MMKRIFWLFAPALVAGFLLSGGAQAQTCTGSPNANTICAGPTSGGAGLPNFRAMVPLDIPVGLNGTPCLNITSTQFGGLGNNVLDNTTPLNNALAALTAPGGCIFFPPGKYKFNSAVSFSIPSGIFSVAIVGGGQDNTILTWPAASGGLTFNYGGVNNSTHFRDLSITTGVANGGTAVRLAFSGSNANPAFGPNGDFYRVTIRGDDGYGVTDYWSAGIVAVSVNNTNLDGVMISGASTPNGQGVNISGTASAIAVVLNAGKSTFNQLATGILYGTDVQGITCDQCNFTGTPNGIAVGAAETGLAQLSVSNSQFAGGVSSSNGILSLSQISNVSLVNNLFLVAQSSSIGVSLSSTGLTTIAGNVFWGQNAAASEQGLSITNTNSLSCNITGNIFFGFNGTSAAGLSLGASTANCVVDGNSFLTNTSNVVDTGTGNQYWNNSGFDPAWATFTATNTCGSATFSPVSSSRKTVGKQTWIRDDFTISGIGSCTNSLTFTLPNTANSSGTLMGGEYAVNNEVAKCLLNSASATATCTKRAGAAFLVNEHWIFTGVYENQ